MIASSEDSTIASERCARRIRACGLFSSSGSEVVSIIGFAGLALSTLLDLSKSRTTGPERAVEGSLEPMTGLEPVTCGLRNRCSTN